MPILAAFGGSLLSYKTEGVQLDEIRGFKTPTPTATREATTSRVAVDVGVAISPGIACHSPWAVAPLNVVSTYIGRRRLYIASHRGLVV